MRGGRVLLEALGVLREHEEAVDHGWVLLGALRPERHTLVDRAAGQGLVELADRETRAELSVYEGAPVPWAARLTGHGHDVLAYAEASPAPDARPGGPVEGERQVELRRSEMDALRPVGNPEPLLQRAGHRRARSLTGSSEFALAR